MITTGLILECQSSSFNLDAHSALHHPHEKHHHGQNKKKGSPAVAIKKTLPAKSPAGFFGLPRRKSAELEELEAVATRGSNAGSTCSR